MAERETLEVDVLFVGPADLSHSLGIPGQFANPIYQDALRAVVAACRKHGKAPVAFSTWELPVQAARWCLRDAGLTPGDLDAVAYSYDPALAPDLGTDVTAV